MPLPSDHPSFSDIKRPLDDEKSKARGPASSGEVIRLKEESEAIGIPTPPSYAESDESLTRAPQRQNFVVPDENEGVPTADSILKNGLHNTFSHHVDFAISPKSLGLPRSKILFASTLSRKNIAVLCGFFMVVAVVIGGFGWYETSKKSQGEISFHSYYGQFLGNISAVVNDVFSVYERATTLGSVSLNLAGEVSGFSNTLVQDILSGNGESIISRIERIDDLFTVIDGKQKDLPSRSVLTNGVLGASSDDDLSARFSLDRYGKFVHAVRAWLTYEGDHHIVVLLQNPSEIRPGGGFIGMYADVVIRRGAIAGVEIHDINDVDRVLSTTTIPPQPLQAIVGNWRTADANWFVNFPDSAARVIQFLEASDLYRKQNIRFDGVIAVNASIFADVLAVTGPIPVPDSKSNEVLTADTFLEKIQKSVQENQKQGKDQPKNIVKVTAPLVLEKIKDGKASQLTPLLATWIARKDVLVYAKDVEIQKFLDSTAISGRQLEIPTNFNGDYLSIVSANIGGQKSDSFIKKEVTSQIRINPDGTAANHVTISYTHTAPSDAAWWYTAQNQSYIQAYTVGTAKLVNINGAWNRTITPKISYAQAGYSSDPLVKQIESSMRIFPAFPEVKSFKDKEKNIYGFWLKTDRGKTSEVSFDYNHDLVIAPQDSVSYDFVFEKQPGDTASYNLEISAPLGYIWKQNHKALYEYKTLDLPARLTLSLTLQKL